MLATRSWTVLRQRTPWLGTVLARSKTIGLVSPKCHMWIHTQFTIFRLALLYQIKKKVIKCSIALQWFRSMKIPFLNINFYLNIEVFRKLKYSMNVNVLVRTWTWIWRTIVYLRLRRKTDDASGHRIVSEWSWLRQLPSKVWDRYNTVPGGLSYSQCSVISYIVRNIDYSGIYRQNLEYNLVHILFLYHNMVIQLFNCIGLT